MEGTLIVKEERGFVDKFRDWYKEANISDRLDKGFETIHKKDEIVNKVYKKAEPLATIATVKILSIIPETAPFAPVFKVVIPPLMKAAISADKVKNDMKYNMIKNTKNTYEKIFINKNNEMVDVKMPDLKSEILEEKNGRTL